MSPDRIIENPYLREMKDRFIGDFLMEEWRIDRIDFVRNTSCKFCDRPLKTNVAFILVDPSGTEVQSGPKCAKNHSLNPKDKVPDFTKASFDVPSEEEDEGSNGKSAISKPSSSRKTSSGPRKEGDEAIEYLRLRMEKLAGFNGASFGKLQEIYGRYASGSIAQEDRAYLTNLMAKMEREHSRYSHSNLQTCYAYAFWMDCFLDKKDSDFIQSVNTALKDKLHLTEGQLEGINKWFEHQKGIPRFRPDAFKGVQHSPFGTQS
jgi:hypothetical protein